MGQKRREMLSPFLRGPLHGGWFNPWEGWCAPPRPPVTLKLNWAASLRYILLSNNAWERNARYQRLWHWKIGNYHLCTLRIHHCCFHLQKMQTKNSPPPNTKLPLESVQYDFVLRTTELNLAKEIEEWTKIMGSEMMRRTAEVGNWAGNWSDLYYQVLLYIHRPDYHNL